MLSGERMIVREAARYWWLFLVSGILWLLIAWMVLRLDATSIATVGVLLGVVFGLSGINEVGQATVSPGGWKVWHYIMAVIFFLGALYGFVRPVNTFFALASVLGLILIFYGAFEIIQGFASRAVNPYWWLNLIMGILLVLLAFWVSESDRMFALARRTYLILFWVGFLALFRGFSQIFWPSPSATRDTRPPPRSATRARANHRPSSTTPAHNPATATTIPVAWPSATRWPRSPASPPTPRPGEGSRYGYSR
jgi:uncharacterized membrane protein HdeD (DUF308 family)